MSDPNDTQTSEAQPKPLKQIMSPRMRHAMMLVGGPRAARGIAVAQRPKPVKQPKPQQWRMELLFVDSPLIGQEGQRSEYLSRKELVNHALQQLRIAGVEVRLIGCSRRQP